MENGKEECWIPKMCFWGGEFASETVVAGRVLQCVHVNGWMTRLREYIVDRDEGDVDYDEALLPLLPR